MKNMNSSKANLLNSIILIAVGSWGYFDGDGKSITALIPVKSLVLFYFYVLMV